MKTSLIMTFLILLISASCLMSQNSVYIFYKNGSPKNYNQNTPFFKTQEASLNLRTVPLKVTSSKIDIIFSQDSLDLFNPNLYLFATTKSFNALDDGSGRKIMYGVKSDTATGTITSNFYNTSNFSIAGSFTDRLFKKTFYTGSDFLPMTDPNKLDFVIQYGGNNSPAIGSPVVKVFNNINGNQLFDLNYRDKNQSGYYYSNVPSSDSSPNLDLNNNGLHEIISLKNLGLFTGWRFYVYDSFSIIDSIDDTRASLFPVFSTTSADLNGDGAPELISSINSSPQFYQWNASIKKFKNIATLPSLTSMYLTSENVDGSYSKDIITQAGLLGDSLYVFDNSFKIKYKIKVPGIGIKRYFIQNVNDSPNKELIVVSNLFFNNGTFIYDLSKGVNPVWIDSTFETLAVGNFKNDGKNYILGLKYTKGQIKINGYSNDIRMVSYDGSNFAKLWDCIASVPSALFGNIAGPFASTDWTSVAAISFFGPGALLNIKPTDLNGDGKNKFVFNVIKQDSIVSFGNYYSFYVLVNSSGEVVDTLPGAYKDCYALAADLNNDGRDELLVTQIKPDILFFPDANLIPKAWVYEYGMVTGINGNPKVVTDYKLDQNYPNPFNPSTTINFQVPASGNVSLKIYDILGREVATVVNENKTAGKYSVVFNAEKLASGIYFYKLQAGNYVEAKKMVLVK